LEHYQEYGGKPQDKLASFDVWWVQNKSPQPGQVRGEALPPEKLTSFGTVRDSLAKPWLTPDKGFVPAPPANQGSRRPPG
jgi:hypothetical protein